MLQMEATAWQMERFACDAVKGGSPKAVPFPRVAEGIISSAKHSLARETCEVMGLRRGGQW